MKANWYYVPSESYHINALYEENVADAFAAIKILQFSDNNLQVLSLLSCLRLYEMAYFHGDTDHMTVPMINRIIEDSNKQQIDFISMTPEQVLKAAEDYAKKYTLIETEKKDAHEFAIKAIPSSERDESIDTYMTSMVRTALSSSPFILREFGMPIFRAFINKPEGAVLRT